MCILNALPMKYPWWLVYIDVKNPKQSINKLLSIRRANYRPNNAYAKLKGVAMHSSCSLNVSSPHLDLVPHCFDISRCF